MRESLDVGGGNHLAGKRVAIQSTRPEPVDVEQCALAAASATTIPRGVRRDVERIGIDGAAVGIHAGFERAEIRDFVNGPVHHEIQLAGGRGSGPSGLPPVVANMMWRLIGATSGDTWQLAIN